MNDMRITFKAFDKMMKLSDLKESRFQRNTHPPEQIERLALIMREHGVTQAIHVHREYGEIAFGHGRKEAMLLNGWTEAPIVFQDFKDDDEYYAKVQSDNGIASWSELDLSMINADLANLGPMNIDLLGIMNFTVDMADKVGLTDEDSIPDNVETRVKLGDVWQLGEHRLMCGDSTSIDAVETLMNGAKADMVFTDPPYGMSAVSSSGVLSAKYKRGDIMNDDNVNVAKDSFNLCIAMDIPKLVFWGANYYSSCLPDATCWLVWDKNNGQSDQMDCELAWTNFNGVTRQFTQASEKQNRVHPTQKPVSLVNWCLERWEAGSVLDLFGGSGSTLIACEKTNRKCFMMELDPHYCSVILKRWEDFTGLNAQRISDET